MIYKNYKIDKYEFRFSIISVMELEELFPVFASAGNGNESLALKEMGSLLWKHLEIKTDSDFEKVTNPEYLDLILNEDKWVYLAILEEFNMMVKGFLDGWRTYREQKNKVAKLNK